MARKTVDKVEPNAEKAPWKVEAVRQFKKWLRANPKANIDQKIEAFDNICDELIGN
jgi:hypothetical protein